MAVSRKPECQKQEHVTNVLKRLNMSDKHTGALELEVESVRVVLGSHGENVVVGSALEQLGHGLQVDTKGQVAVAAEGRETIRPQKERDETDV